MAVAKMCDACGSFFKFESDQNAENGLVTYHFNQDGKPSKALKNYELCPSCLTKVYNILDNRIIEDDEEE